MKKGRKKPGPISQRAQKRRDRRVTAKQQERAASRPQVRARSVSLRLPEDKTQPGTISYDALRWGLGKIAAEKGHWAGIPVPLDGTRLVIEPTFPNAAFLSSFGQKVEEEDPLDPDAGWKFRNQWYSRDHRCDIILMERDGKISWGKKRAFHHLDHDFATLMCSDVWGLAQEEKALELLASLVTERQMKQYLLTGMMLESSKKSGVFYLFRRLKPTVAISGRDRKGGGMTILACLCQHPIAYYEGSWAGAMTPTDDVIAMLMLMRGDEHMLWKRSNQHPPHRPEAGL